MKGRNLVIVLLGALFLAVALVFWLGATSGGRASEDGLAQSAAGRGGPATGGGSAATASARGDDGGPIAETVADRRVRDELRRRILAAWASGEGDTATAAREGRLPPMPEGPDGHIDPKYIQSVIREDMFPMASKCYEELLTRKPDAGGRIEMVFKIVGDDQLGGIIEEAELDGGVAGAFGDPTMETCIRESLLSLAFRPPPKDGWVTVVYPIELAPGDGDD
ncbi:MAG: AgmX/PglI C-terminal domain-containing protein [Labilithrix sp.]|nr:AgmX/PglI C-terminal domain-containing protein [Labilithrix sp.]MBX3220420.1 AgmX/PglI C-terminal domain-containing protein [Labilithrix sp.]